MISLDQVQKIATELCATGVSDEVISALRQTYKPIHFTYCMDDDIPNNSPILEEASFNLYLIDGRDHCLCFTNDYAVATGLVVAEIIAD
jgi:hypothetical protein